MVNNSSITGVVVGAAVGDALGAPFEFKRAKSYHDRFPEPVLDGIGEMVGGGSFGWAPGEFTDDTQMGLVLAESLLEHDLTLNLDDLWDGWLAWRDGASDIGVSTRHALSFADWRDVTHHNPEMTAGNGALMRAFPLALIPASREERLRWTLDQSNTTHHHPDAGWGAWLAVSMIRGILDGKDGFGVLAEELTALPDESRTRFEPLLSPDWDPSASKFPNGTVWGCLADAVWAVRGSTSFEGAVVRAVNRGDDADTVACVAGAIAGAMYSEQLIPGRWLSYVHGTVARRDGQSKVYGVEDLENVARRLADLGVGNPRPESKLGPTMVDDRLYAANRSGARDCPADWAVLSLCRTERWFKDHDVRRQWYIVDDSHGNPDLGFVVDDVVASINALRAEGRTVLVHCEGGRSRTCLALLAWRMDEHGASYEGAKKWLSGQWPHCSGANRSFDEHLRRREKA